MIALEVADLVVIASRALGLDTGQVLDLLDPADRPVRLEAVECVFRESGSFGDTVASG